MNEETRRPGDLTRQPPPIPLAASEIDRATLQLLDGWRTEDAMCDANEIRDANWLSSKRR